MIGKVLRLGGLGTLFLAILLAGCAPATSNLAVSDAWARAASASAGGMDMSADAASTQDSGTPAMDMTEATPTMDMASETPAAEADSGMPGMSSDSAGGGVSAAYMTITNTGGAADRLVSVATDAAGTVELHTSEMDEAGVMRMRPLTDGLEVPANGSVSLEPGGYHVMLMDLQHDLNPGDTVTLTLTFSSGTTLTAEAEVRPPQ